MHPDIAIYKKTLASSLHVSLLSIISPLSYKNIYESMNYKYGCEISALNLAIRLRN